VRGKALTEEEELLLRGVAEKAVAQLVAAQRELTRLQARESDLSERLGAAEASLASATAQLAARTQAAEQLGALLDSTTKELQEQIADLERSSSFQLAILREQKDCALRELAALELRAGAAAAAAAAAPRSPKPGEGAGERGGAASLSPPPSPRVAAAAVEACARCGAECGGAGGSRCGSCAHAVYCCRVCQVEHWPAHRAACEEAEAVLRRTLEQAQQELGDSEETLERMGAYAAFLRRVGRFGDALGQLRGMAAVSRRLHGDAHPHTLTLAYNAAALMEQLGDAGAAEPLLCEVLEGRRRAHGESHPLTQRALLALARVRKDIAARAKKR
jgi:hypothetical protein